MREEKELVCIEFKNMNMGQLLFVQAVVIPEIELVLAKYVNDLKQLQ